MRLVARFLILAAIAITGCNGFDRLLEGTDVFDGALAVAVPSSAVTIAQGKELAFTTTVTRTGELRDDIVITVDGAPPGLAATVSSTTTSGRLTTANLTLTVGPTTSVGNYVLTIRARSGPSVSATTLLSVAITHAPAFALTISSNTLTIARGGIARLAVTFARTNLTAPIGLALTGSSGISATFITSPIGGDTVLATIVVPASVAPGTYTLGLRATAEGLTDQTAQLTVTVTADPIQVIVGQRVTTAQGSTVVLPVIVNHAGVTGAISLSADNLPTGVTATFDPSTPTGSTATMSLRVGPTTPPGAYVVSVKGSAAGLPETTTTLELNVTLVSLSLGISPRDISVFQGGASATSALRVTRTGYAGSVALDFENVPQGLQISADPAAPTGDSVTVTLSASGVANPGQYDVTVRATPSGFPATASATAIIAVSIRAAPPGGGNVTLDWSRCTAPDWVAYQDGTAGWTQAPIASGVARFQMSAARGGVAYVEGGSTVATRFGLQAEFTAKPLNMCQANPGTKTISGFTSFGAVIDQMTFRMGGAFASATGSIPAFTLVGVEDGTHDLVGWGQLSVFGRRGIIRRDVNLASGASLGILDPLGLESFVPATASLTPSGVAQGEQTSHTMNYLTTEACTPNLLYQVAGTALVGVPSGIQRPTDYHMVNLVASAGTRQRSATLTIKTLTNFTLALPPVPTVPAAVSPFAGAPYRRLSAFVGGLSALYNGTITLRYNDGASRTMVVTASAAYLVGTGFVLATPLFSGVSGWQTGYAVDANASGTWVVSLEGSTPGPTCSEGKISYLTTQTGRY